MIEGCTCEEGLGLTHDPHWAWQPVQTVRVSLGMQYRPPERPLRLWVDWKAVARALALTDGGDDG